MDMIAIEDYKYERPNYSKIEANFCSLLSLFEKAKTVAEQNRIIKEINNIRIGYSSLREVAFIRFSTNTADAFYTDEIAFFDEVDPMLDELIVKYYSLLIHSKFKDELEKIWGEQLFFVARSKTKAFSKEIIKYMQEENVLFSRYNKLTSSSLVKYDEKELNIYQLVPFKCSEDRQTRKNAFEAWTRFFEKNADEFDHIFDHLVKLRHKMAQEKGYDNFIPLAYQRMMRGFTPEMAQEYRNETLKYITPILVDIRKKQAARLKIERVKYYDESVLFSDGNAKMKGDTQWMIKQSKKMFTDMSSETGKLFDFMVEHELLDLETRNNKITSAFCRYIFDKKMPFIIGNGGSGNSDLYTFVHEFGHAFQVSSCQSEMIDQIVPTDYLLEVPSIGIEFLIWDWADIFFEGDALKYQYAHMVQAIEFILYASIVDEFQCWVYENVEASPMERRKKWREIEKKYMPTIDYCDNEFLENGGLWFRQIHLFGYPFYFIDYGLTNICGFQLWDAFKKDRKETWENYVRLCKSGGKLSTSETLKRAHIDVPFDKGVVKKAIMPVKKWLDEAHKII